MNDRSVEIGGRRVGRGYPCYLVAELSGNHNGHLSRALETIRAAAEAGADAIKLQTYTADTLTIDSDAPDFIVPGDGPWGGRSLYDLYREAHTPWEWHPDLFAEARRCRLAVFSTPFDETAIKLLESLEAPAYKIASFELVDDELLRAVAETRKPVILSTGMATEEETEHAISVLRDSGCADLVLLRCTSSYPAPDEAMALASIPVLADRMQCVVGLSDHSLGTTAPVVAVALGASMIEKHLTLHRRDGGVDSHFSLEPTEFADLVRDVRRAEAMLGSPAFGPSAAEEASLVFRRSLYVVQDLAKGDEFTRDNVRAIRPGYGLAPRHLADVLGRRSTRSVSRGTALRWEMVESLGPA